MSQDSKPRHAYDLYSDAEWESVSARSQPFSAQVKNLFRDDPGIPIFLGLTCVALTLGMRQSFVVNDPTKANAYMAMRVLSQAGAAVAVGYSIMKLGAKDQQRANEIADKINAEKAARKAQDL